MSAPQNAEETSTTGEFGKLTGAEIAHRNAQLTQSLQDRRGEVPNVNAESHKTDAPVLASPSKSTVEAGDLFRRNSGYGEKEEKGLGDASMKMSSILDRSRDWFTCPSCSTINYWHSFSSGEQLKCNNCKLELEENADGSVKPSGEAATGQSANVTGNEGRGSDDDSQWADTESEAADS
ncbi:hypothetical protein HBH50_123680 [Parastagonospora nodorum]|nr:hypothetical protein HBH50_123680 [Parastagonospora nodorum]KAH4085582.1 hypothetical protein HBH48_151470 [Parastagonospora nodorum]